MPNTSARTLRAGEITATFLPGLGMLGSSLRHRGDELLGRVDDIETAAAAGSTCGIPLLHPWANRLDGPRYRVSGREVELDTASPLLHLDAKGLPIHGVPWSRLAWDVMDESGARLEARLGWGSPELLALFPFPHRLELAVSLDPAGLTLATELVAGEDGPVPVSFGFHPYLRLPGLERDAWRLAVPSMRQLVLDGRGIPNGEERAFPGFDGPLGELDFDDGFADLPEHPSFSLQGGGRRISVTLSEGYTHAQVFAPAGQAFVALEPMTAPTNALASGRGLRLVSAGSSFRATFRIGVEDV